MSFLYKAKRKYARDYSIRKNMGNTRGGSGGWSYKSCKLFCYLSAIFGTKTFVYIFRKPNAKEGGESGLMPLEIIFQKIIRLAMAVSLGLLCLQSEMLGFISLFCL
jgi:hypothetical protein